MKKTLILLAGLSVLGFGKNIVVGNTLVNTATNLQWQDTMDVPTETYLFEAAIQRCEDLVLDGYDDWRLPNLNEMIFQTNYQIEAAASKGFTYNFAPVAQDTWTSTPHATGYYGFANKWGNFNKHTTATYHGTVRCVRDYK